MVQFFAVKGTFAKDLEPMLLQKPGTSNSVECGD